jgi:hypothetical protein
MFTVILDAQFHGSSVMTTKDTIEAATPAEAEAKAIDAWKAMEPRTRTRRCSRSSARRTTAPRNTTRHGP